MTTNEEKLTRRKEEWELLKAQLFSREMIVGDLRALAMGIGIAALAILVIIVIGSL